MGAQGSELDHGPFFRRRGWSRSRLRRSQPGPQDRVEPDRPILAASEPHLGSRRNCSTTVGPATIVSQIARSRASRRSRCHIGARRRPTQRSLIKARNQRPDRGARMQQAPVYSRRTRVLGKHGENVLMARPRRTCRQRGLNVFRGSLRPALSGQPVTTSSSTCQFWLPGKQNSLLRRRISRRRTHLSLRFGFNIPKSSRPRKDVISEEIRHRTRSA